MLLDIIELKILDDFEILLKFENNELKRFSIKHLLNEKPFTLLQDKNIFRLAYLENGTLCWPQEIDIALEYLNNHSQAADWQI